jgi:hypothetical protein
MKFASMIVVSGALIAPVGALAVATATPSVMVAAERTSEGTIKSVDAGKNEFVLSVGIGNDKKDVTVKVAGTTTYSLDGQPSTMAEALKVGNTAKATIKDDIATNVDAKSPKKPS